MLKKEAARLRANEIIESSGQTTPSVDLLQIANSLNITLQITPLVDGLAGMAFIKDGMRHVVVNDSHGNNRQRFTIAHEIGHHVLHADALVGQVHVDKLVLRRNEVSATGKDLMEIEANNFAAELLMPTAWLDCYLPQDFDPEDDNLVADLAKTFEVSPAAIYYKLLSSQGNRR